MICKAEQSTHTGTQQQPGARVVKLRERERQTETDKEDKAEYKSRRSLLCCLLLTAHSRLDTDGVCEPELYIPEQAPPLLGLKLKHM